MSADYNSVGIGSKRAVRDLNINVWSTQPNVLVDRSGSRGAILVGGEVVDDGFRVRAAGASELELIEKTLG